VSFLEPQIDRYVEPLAGASDRGATRIQPNVSGAEMRNVPRGSR
jgi:hypothetical protein